MMKGKKKLASKLILDNKVSFEDDSRYSIRASKTSGITVKSQLFPSDKKERYFPIYYSSRKHAFEREQLESKINRYVKHLEKYKGKSVGSSLKSYEKYFDLIYYHEGKEDEVFTCARERTRVINQEISLCATSLLLLQKKCLRKRH